MGNSCWRVEGKRKNQVLVADHEHLLAEDWQDELGRRKLILHCPLGERLNRTWGIALADAAEGTADYPLFAELRRLFSRESLDVEACRELLRGIQTGTVRVPVQASEAPSPLIPELGDELIGEFYSLPAAEVIQRWWLSPHEPESARWEVVARYLRSHGPVSLYDLMNHTGWAAGELKALLSDLELAKTVVSGVYTKEKPKPQWMWKANLERIHRRTLGYLRRELAACASIRWHPRMRTYETRSPPCGSTSGIGGPITLTMCWPKPASPKVPAFAPCGIWRGRGSSPAIPTRACGMRGSRQRFLPATTSPARRRRSYGV